MLPMKEFDWKLPLKTNIFMLRLVGLWPETDRYNCDFYSVYAIFVGAILIGSHDVFQILNMCFVYDSLEGLLQTIIITITDILASLKIYFFVKNIKLLKRLMAALSSDLFQPKTVRQRRIVQPHLNFWKTTYNTFYVMGIISAGSWLILPFVDKSFRKRRLPFVAWYPYDTTISPLYQLTYLLQTISVTYFSIAIVNMDMMITALMMYIRTQCEILCDNLENLQDVPEIKSEIVKCIHHHKEIVRFSDSCDDFSSMIILGQFFTAVVAIAISMFQMSLVDPLSSGSLSHLAYIAAITAQVFLYCWFGNEVELKSSQIPYSAFESDWTGIPIEAKKNLLIFIMRAQRPIKMSAINLFSLSLATFTTILRTSWSYFAVLRQVNAQE